ncbi:helix-turn-helix transcriptional regulator [Nonomuraea sp. 10N515B]
MTTTPVLREEDPLLTFEEVAALARVPVKTLRHYRAIGKGPEFFPIGRRLKIRESKARAWIEQFENAPAE